MITINKSRFIENVYNIFLFTTVISTNLLATIWSYSVSISPWNNEILLSCIWSFLLTALSLLIDLPSSIYRTFILQRKYELNRITIKSFVLHQVQICLLNQCTTIPLLIVIIWFVKHAGGWLYVSVWLALSLLTVLSLIIYPIYFAPICDDYKPLPQGELKTKIEELAYSLNYPLEELYVVKDGKLTHNNAFLYVLTGPKHIVLSETLLQSTNNGHKNDEILAILSHEFGHWVHNHVIKHVVLGQAYLMSMLITYKFMINYPLTYQVVGFAQNVQPLLPGLVVVLEYVLEPVNALFSFAYNYFSRTHEFEADAFVKELGKVVHLKNALMKLNKSYTDFPVYDSLFTIWYHERPTLLQRLDALN
ncbi:hypothetical protein RN001_006909 [Aquatica leii]|uniref:CAAX prenyl protease n=1 Tax=Aquatica leii TaxID=1421715 RepID=A0AAN7SSC2_9COLE|nr:hypothetical protein RN001_006909 [Aquatica leii]